MSPLELAPLLPSLRPKLHRTAFKRTRASREDLEDIVEDTIVIALEKVAGTLRVPSAESSDPSHQSEHFDAVHCWLQAILSNVIKRFQAARAKAPQTVPLETAVETPSPPPLVPRDQVLKAKINQLPEKLRWLTLGWLDGRTQQELARTFEIDRNTVANRLELAFQQLGSACPDEDELTYSTSDIDYCSRHAIYHKPAGTCARWMHTHPPDHRFPKNHSLSPCGRGPG